MARKRRQRLSLKGIQFSKGSQLSIHKRGWKVAKPERVEIVSLLLPDGSIQQLSTYESQVYRALRKLGIEFIAQAQFGGNGLGGVATDFFLPQYNIMIEVQGEFHFKAGGAALDLVRFANRKALGVSAIIEIFPGEMRNIIEVLRKKIGIVT